MIGQTLGHYRIIEKIGAGGMGEVYRARDERLARDVAVKVLPAGVLSDEASRKCFRNEALALSKLNHPNIETVHDFDTQDGVDFLAMEYIIGTTLAQKLSASGSLPEKEVLGIGSQIAAALEESHERGVVHRDLKPGNVMLTAKGQVKVLDFGLARLLRPGADLEATQTMVETQAVAGTLPYMAPERLQGEEADARSDIWAVGAVLYEMATGRRAFAAKLPTALSADIQHKPSLPPRQLNPKISPRLEEVILKCLEKEAENRYQSARELCVDLRRLAMPTATAAVRPPASSTWRTPARTAALIVPTLLGSMVLLVGLNVRGWRDRLLGRASTPRIESLAVLPLENLSGDPQQEYFVDGMTDTLIAELSKISALKVISRTSAMQYKGVKKKPLPQIARELGVDGIVAGTVMREGDQVRISVQLIHGPTDRNLWADHYQREVRNVLTMQGEVASAIAHEVKVKLTPQEQARFASARPVNPEAYEAYLKGRYYLNSWTSDGQEKAIEHLNRALQIDPGYALAYAALAEAYVFRHPFLATDPRLQKGRDAALKAVALDDTLAEAQVSLGLVRLFDWDWSAAEAQLKRAVELNPNSAVAHDFYTMYLILMRRFEEALVETKRARELDPLSALHLGFEGSIFNYLGQHDRALEVWRSAADLSPNSAGAHFAQGMAYLYKGMNEEAVNAARNAEKFSAGEPRILAIAGYVYGRAGRRDEARRLLKKLGELSKGKSIPASYLAFVYAGLEEKDEAFARLEQAYQQHESELVGLRVHPMYDPLRNDPRFQDLLRRMNFPK